MAVGSALSRLADSEVVRRCREGSDEAWHELVERFSRYVYAICRRGFGLSPQEAEDAFQEVFVRIYTRLDSLRDDGAVRPWIAQVARRVCLDSLAAGSHERTVDELPEEEQEVTLDEIEEALTVRDALEKLEEPCQDLLDRFFARDESYRTICEELELPPGTVASRISRCLAKLRQELEGRKPPSPPSGTQ